MVIFAAMISAGLLAAVISNAFWAHALAAQKSQELERHFYEKLYGSLSFHLLAMKVLNIKKADLIEEGNAFAKKWLQHVGKIAELFEAQSSYIKKEHLPIIEDFYVGKHRYFNGNDPDKLWRAVQSIQEQVTARHRTGSSLDFSDFDLRQFALMVVLATLLILVSLAVAMIVG